MRADRPQIWLRISAFGQPMGFELRVGDSAHELALEDAAGPAHMGEWLMARAVDPDRVPALVEAVGKLRAIARALDERGRSTPPAVASTIGEPAGQWNGR